MLCGQWISWQISCEWAQLSDSHVLDDFNREGLGIEVDLSLPAARVVRSLDQIIEWRGKADALRCDNRPEYISRTLLCWAEKHGIAVQFIQPGKPQQKCLRGAIQSHSAHEWLEMNEFNAIEHAQAEAAKWLWTYNNERPDMALGGITPAMKLAQANNIMNATS